MQGRNPGRLRSPDIKQRPGPKGSRDDPSTQAEKREGGSRGHQETQQSKSQLEMARAPKERVTWKEGEGCGRYKRNFRKITAFRGKGRALS